MLCAPKQRTLHRWQLEGDKYAIQLHPQKQAFILQNRLLCQATEAISPSLSPYLCPSETRLQGGWQKVITDSIENVSICTFCGLVSEKSITFGSSSTTFFPLSRIFAWQDFRDRTWLLDHFRSKCSWIENDIQMWSQIYMGGTKLTLYQSSEQLCWWNNTSSA